MKEPRRVWQPTRDKLERHIVDQVNGKTTFVPAPAQPDPPLEDHVGISNSEIQSWKRCKRKWFLHYYKGYQADRSGPITGSSQQGTRGHVALQAYYGHGLDPVTVTRAIYQREAELHPAATADLTKEFDQTIAILEGYAEHLEETGIDRGLTPVAAEQRAWYPIGDFWGVAVILMAHLDVVVYDQFSNRYLFIDHKFVASFDSANLLQINEQMKTYVMLQRAISLVTGTSVAGGLFNMLKRSKRTSRANPPFYKREPVAYNNEDMDSMWLRITSTVSDIIRMRQLLAEPGADHRYLVPPTPSFTCSWDCPFFVQCPMMDDGSRWEAALDGKFQIGDPYDYYSHTLLETLKEEGRI